MKRKLRKSLSWLLTVAMVASLFCGTIPTASAASTQVNATDAEGNIIATITHETPETLNNYELQVKIMLDGELVGETETFRTKGFGINPFSVDPTDTSWKFKGSELDSGTWIEGSLTLHKPSDLNTLTVFYTTDPDVGNQYTLVEQGAYDGQSNQSDILSIQAEKKGISREAQGTVIVTVDEEERERIPVQLYTWGVSLTLDFDRDQYSFVSAEAGGVTYVTEDLIRSNAVYPGLSDDTIRINLASTPDGQYLVQGHLGTNEEDLFDIYETHAHGDLLGGGTGTVNVYVSNVLMMTESGCEVYAGANRYNFSFDETAYTLDKFEVIGERGNSYCTYETLDELERDPLYIYDGFTMNVYLVPVDHFTLNIDRRNMDFGVFDDIADSVTLSWTYHGQDYTYEYQGDDWSTFQVKLPQDTRITVQANMNEGYQCVGWWTGEATGMNTSLYTDTGFPAQMGYVIAGSYGVANLDTIQLQSRAHTVTLILRGADADSMPQFYSYTIEYYFVDEDGKETQSETTDTLYSANGPTNGPIGYYRQASELKEYDPSYDYTLDAERTGDLIWTEDGQVFRVYYHVSGGSVTPPIPGEDYAITDFDKELVTTEAEATEAGATGITFPDADGTVTVPVNAEVKLLYKLTVTGKPNADYTITDDGVEVESGSLTGNLGEAGNAVVYVAKTFGVDNFTEDDKLVNSATITTTTAGGVANGEEEAKAETSAEEGAPIATEDVLNRDLDNSFVTIHCTTAETSFGHEDKTYGLLLNGYTISNVTGDGSSTDPWKVTVTISLENAEAYVNAYEADNDSKEHTLNPGQETQAIVLNWDTTDKKWEVAPVSEAPVVYTVTCDDDNSYGDSYSEFHVMNLTDIKQAVADEKNITDIDNIKIYTIGVTGTVARTVDSLFYGDVAETTGGADKYLGTADLGYAVDALTINGYLTDYSAWKILNSAPFIDNDTVTSITIYYKYNDAKGSVTVPCTDFEKIVRLEDKPYITQIWLDVEPDEPEPEPEPEYTLTYNYNDATEDAGATTETGATRYASGTEVPLKEVSHTADNDGVVFVGWTEDQNPYTKSAPATEQPDGLVTEVTFQDENITVYAAWAQDANNNGKPDYKEGFVKQNVYVYAKPTGSGPNKTLTDDEKENLKETYRLTLNNSGYCVLGKLTNVLLPVAAEQDPDMEYYSTYARVIEAAFEAGDKFERYPSATYDPDLIDVLVWNHLSVAAGAEGYAEAPSNIRCWHLDGDLDVTFKYDLTFHANGGNFTGPEGSDTLTIHDLTVGKYEISDLAGYQQPFYDTSNVEFGGWATERPSKAVYKAGDTDVPTTVTSVTLPTTQELWAVWGYDTDGDGTADVNQIVITPADITIYTGGTGYSGIVTSDDGTQMAGQTNGFPEPGYYITLPTNLNNALLEALDDSAPSDGIVKLSDYVDFTYDKDSTTREWVMSTYDEKGESRTSDDRYIYRLGDSKIDGGSETIAIRISITASDGSYVGSDSEFTPATDGLYQTYSMTINPGLLDRSAIQLSLRSGTTLSNNSELASLLENYGVFVDSGTLIVRGVNDTDNTDHVRDIEDTAPATAVNQITAHAGSGVSYNINDSDLAVADDHQIMLLVDTLTDSFEDTETLKKAAVEELKKQGIDTEDLTFTEFRYLDLVDNSNGNAYVTLGDGQTVNIYWPNPDEDSEAYYVIHFDKLDRNHTDLNTALGSANISVYSSVDSEQTAPVKELTVDKNSNLVFTTGSFSPFVVAYRDGGSTPPAPQKVTVTFQSGSHGYFGGNTTTQTVQVTAGGHLSKTQIPTVYADSNYRFDGWSYNGTTYTSSHLSRLSFNSDATITATYSYVGGSHGGSGGGSGGGNDNDSDPTGNLSIELDVNGDGSFTFTVILTDKDGDDLENNFYFNGDFTGTIGSGDGITLENGEEIIIRNLPEGTRYEIIVEDADGFHLIADGDTGIIHTGMNEAEFTGNPVVQLADPSVTGVSRWLNVTDHIAYLTGYPSGGFGPDNSMTRAEVAQMFYALLNNKDVPITRTFPDVPADAWYATAVNTLASLGMVSGDETGNYRPNDPITRAEFCVIALAFAYEPENTLCWFTDVNTGDWFYSYVAQAASYGWIGGYTDGTFGPNNPITRAQVTTIVNNMLGRAADRDYVLDHQEDLVQFNDLTRGHWAFFQIMEATNTHDYTIRRGEENWR